MANLRVISFVSREILTICTPILHTVLQLYKLQNLRIYVCACVKSREALIVVYVF